MNKSGLRELSREDRFGGQRTVCAVGFYCLRTKHCVMPRQMKSSR